MDDLQQMTDSYSRLLAWHAAHIRSVGYIEFGATILRTRSKALHDVLAYVATDDKYTVLQLKKLVYDGTFQAAEFRNQWLATLGRVVTLQALEEMDPELRAEELDFGMICLKHANRQLARNRENQQFHRLEIELSLEKGLVKEARRLLDGNEFLDNFFHGYLRSDLDNPVISGKQDTYGRWISGFNRPFTENGLLPIKPSSSLKSTFNDLTTEVATAQTVGPKVSVLMTSYKPNREDFLTAVNSVVEQSWQNLELIIVDDASPREFDSTLAEAEGLDKRVRVIRLKENGGTYRARNIGILAATGEFLTGQDSDDWSHPERIALQIEYLLENPLTPGVIVEAIRADNRLVRTFPGRIPHGPCEVSFMLRVELAREVGGYLEARKGADGEFRRRVEKYTGTKVHALKKPLYLIRIGHESLSRAEFKPGWAHPVRRAFWNSSRHWHENTPVTELRLAAESSPPIPIPDAFKIAPSSRAPKYDVVYVGDWRASASTQRTMIDEIIALRSQGKTVGILHSESIMSPSNEPSRLFFEIQAMVNAGEVSVVIPDENRSTKVAILCDPTLLQFASCNEIGLTADLIIIKPDRPPPAAGSPEVMYLPEMCNITAEKIFGGRVIWASNDPAIIRNLKNYHSKIEICEELYPFAFRPQQWYNTRRRVVNNSCIIGRHSANYEAQWPQDLSICSALWPHDGSSDVYILGDARSFLRKHSLPRFPSNWIVYRDKEIRPEAFMSSLDFFVFFPETGYPQEFCREALEAAASGAVVILPESFRNVHEDTALYAAPSTVPTLISHYVSQPSEFDHFVQETYRRLSEIPFQTRFLDYLERVQNKYLPFNGTEIGA